jgi:hypothetical protein
MALLRPDALHVPDAQDTNVFHGKGRLDRP